MDTDEALERLGKYGKWNLLVYALFSMSGIIPQCLNVMSYIFIAGTPADYNCKVPPNATIPNTTDTLGYIVKDKCHIYKDDYENVTVPCNDGIQFHDEGFGSTIITDWELVCSRESLAELTVTINVVGTVLGSLIWPVLADRFGRKPIHYISLFIMSAICASQSLAPNYLVFTMLRLGTGLIEAGVYTTAFVAACEILPSDMRTFGGIFLEVWWALTMLLLCFLAYFIRNWRHLNLAVALIPLGSFFVIWFIPESIPWLVANNKIDEAEELLKRGAKMNGVKMPDHPLKRSDPANHDSEPSSAKDVSVMSILKSRVLRKNFLAISSLWFTNTLVYWGISFTSTMLSGERYLNFFYNSLVEIPAIVICLICLPRFGRRASLFAFHFISGASLITVSFIPDQANGTDITGLKTALTMFGKLAITSSFNSILLYTTEVFPTNARNGAFGAASFTAKIAAMVAPYSIILGRVIPWLPGVIFAAFSFVVSFTGLFLPETLNRPLPQTVEEIEEWDKTHVFWGFPIPEKQKRSTEDLQHLEETINLDDFKSK